MSELEFFIEEDEEGYQMVKRYEVTRKMEK